MVKAPLDRFHLNGPRVSPINLFTVYITKEHFWTVFQNEPC